MTQPLESRIQSLLDGSIDESNFHHLEDELLASPEARAIYYQYAALHQGLEFRLSRSTAGTSMTGLADARSHLERLRSRRIAVFAAAALVIISLVCMRLYFVAPSQKPEAQFATAPGTVFTLTHSGKNKSGNEHHLAPESRLQVSQGTVELNFSNGVQAIVQGPADMTLHDENKLYIDTGTGWFHVPEQAKGFTVVTRELKVIDLGTEFGVLSHPEKDDEVHVFKGKVQVEALHGVKKSTSLTAGEAVLVRPYGRFQVVTNTPEGFQHELPKTLPHIHWSFDDKDKLLTSNTIHTASQLNSQLHNTPSSSPLLSQGKFGTALSLDGSSQYLSSDWPGILGNAPRSVAFWMKLPTRRSAPPVVTKTIIGWGTQQEGDLKNYNTKWTIHLDFAENRHPMLNISFGGFWFYAPETSLDDNSWHHITVTYDGQSDENGHPHTRLYIDGKAHHIAPAFSSPPRTDQEGQVMIDTLENTPLVIGATLSRDPALLIRPEYFLEAQIDELFIIEGSISEKSVLQLMETNQLTH
ncbi:hypothetical protein JIN77_05395 [Verrucomicrobiaceae bacterium R5-34]|nr:hypothetical protein [Verrucomicrobiaceae bacterium R5-34]